MKPERYPDHVPEDNNLFLKMVKNFRGHIILNCEASTLLPHQECLQRYGWTFVSTMQLIYVALQDWVLMEALDRLVDPTRRVLKTFGMVLNVVFPLQSLKSIGARPFLGAHLQSHLQAISFVKNLKNMKMTRARMSVTRVCIYHIDNVEQVNHIRSLVSALHT